ncbi:MAG: GDP-mannose 4,6-dehydratase [Rhodanobacteraceae bacterium]
MTARFRHALITGISGQDGAWLAARLLAAGVRVSGTHRPARLDPWRLDELGIAGHQRLHLHALDLLDADACHRLLAETGTDAIFHLAGQSSVAESLDDPLGTIAANGLSSLNLLEAMRHETPTAHAVIASSAQMFATCTSTPCDESTPLVPDHPYGLSKLMAHRAVGSWRATFDLAASSAILFNHESELRGETFVTRKISRAVARIALGRAQSVRLGNLDAQRDFGYAPDYVDAMIRLVQRVEPGDFVLATGFATSIREFATCAFAAVDIALDWQGTGCDEVGIERGGNSVRVCADPALRRAHDRDLLIGDAGKARRELDLVASVDVAGIAQRMVLADVARERGEPPLQRPAV